MAFRSGSRPELDRQLKGKKTEATPKADNQPVPQFGANVGNGYRAHRNKPGRQNAILQNPITAACNQPESGCHIFNATLWHNERLKLVQLALAFYGARPHHQRQKISAIFRRRRTGGVAGF